MYKIQFTQWLPIGQPYIVHSTGFTPKNQAQCTLHGSNQAICYTKLYKEYTQWLKLYLVAIRPHTSIHFVQRVRAVVETLLGSCNQAMVYKCIQRVHAVLETCNEGVQTKW